MKSFCSGYGQGITRETKSHGHFGNSSIISKEIHGEVGPERQTVTFSIMKYLKSTGFRSLSLTFTPIDFCLFVCCFLLFYLIKTKDFCTQ